MKERSRHTYLAYQVVLPLAVLVRRPQRLVLDVLRPLQLLLKAGDLAHQHRHVRLPLAPLARQRGPLRCEGVAQVLTVALRFGQLLLFLGLLLLEGLEARLDLVRPVPERREEQRRGLAVDGEALRL
jgi:hypothetical protein